MNTSLTALTAEPTLTIQTLSSKKIYTLSELLKRTDVETIKITDGPAYKGSQEYQAIKVANLFKEIEIPENAVIQFKALDGFSAPLHKNRLLNTSKKEAIAYIAIEKSKWPALKPGKPSAGPFYLVWQNPELSQIGPEEWPYMLAAFEVKGTLETVYPKIFPDKKIKPEDPIYRGFQAFVKNCFACHTINKNGIGNLGPDLNVPMNVTEYFTEAGLKKLIRNPQSVRHWPKGIMIGFSKEALSDQDIEDIISYLKHMKK